MHGAIPQFFVEPTPVRPLNRNVSNTPRVVELNHVALHVADLAASRRFYGELMGFAPMERPAFDFAGAWFRLGPVQELHLIAGRSEPVVSANRGNHFALRVESLPPWEDHLRRAGWDFVPPKPRPDGALQLFLRDPDGHVIELFTPPSGAVEA